MRLDFNVLWVEDQQSAVESQCKRIEYLVKKEGFRLQVKFASSVEQAKNYLSDDIYGDHIDLILMDYDLGTGGRGDQGLVEIRKIFSYKDVVFYSSQAENLSDKVAKIHVDGVFCSTRNDLPDTVNGLFEALVKKVLDIDHSRGIVMGATSDIDHYVNDCLLSCFDRSDEGLQKRTLTVVARHVKEKRKSFEKELDEISAIKCVSELQKFHNAYTSNDRIRLLKNVLNSAQLYVDNIPDIVRYMEKTVPKRNDLAHVRVKVDGFSRKLFDRNNNELTSAQMKQLRQELLEYQDLFEGLFEKLNASVAQAE